MRIVSPNPAADTRKPVNLNANDDNVLARIVAIVSNLVTDETTITQDTAMQADVGMTSLQVMELVLEIEDEFDISFPLNHLPDIHTVRDLAREVVAVLDQ